IEETITDALTRCSRAAKSGVIRLDILRYDALQRLKTIYLRRSLWVASAEVVFFSHAAVLLILSRPSVSPLVLMSSLTGKTQLWMRFEPVEPHRQLRPAISPFSMLQSITL